MVKLTDLVKRALTEVPFHGIVLFHQLVKLVRRVK